MADTNWTPNNQANAINGTPETKKVESPEELKIQGYINAWKNAVIAIATLSLWALSASASTAYAWWLPPDELGKQEKATIEANWGIIKVDDLKWQLAKLEVKNPDEVAKMYEWLDNLDKSLVWKYLNIWLKSPNNARLKNWVVNLIEWLNNKKIYTAFLQKPTWDTVPEWTTASNFVNASKAFTWAELIISQEMKAEIKGLDNEVVRVRTGIANKQIKVADEQIKVADEKIILHDKFQSNMDQIWKAASEVIDTSKAKQI